jgi:hypothetical protein
MNTFDTQFEVSYNLTGKNRAKNAVETPYLPYFCSEFRNNHGHMVSKLHKNLLEPNIGSRKQFMLFLKSD